ncbi:MAG: MATE family efflux transporter [Clostridia bacterium]|nr:MATE family efflux transporter [Clostridia bacterium]
MKLTKEQRKLFYTLMFPALIERVLTQLFHLVDSMMVGQMENSTPAVAAVGLCGAPINLIVGVSTAFFIGTTATVAWHKGANHPDKVRNTAYQSMLIAVGVALLFTVISVLAARPIMTFVCGRGNENLELAVTYYRINAYGFFFQILTANITACYRGVGISNLPMVYNLIGGVGNVVLNYLLIYGHLGLPAMGIAGAALATSISKGISLLIAIGSLFLKRSPIQYQKEMRLKPERTLMTRLLPIGLTSAGEQLILQSGATITSKIIAVLPTPAIAANQVVNNLEAFAWSTGGACNAASTTLFGQSMGAGNEKQARRYLRLTLFWAWGFAAMEMLIMSFAGRPLAMAFTNDTSLYPTISGLLVISAMALPFINSHQSISGALRGAGDSVAPLIASLVSLWIFRVGGGFLTIHLLDWGVNAYRWCLVADQAVRCTCVAIFYLTGHWRRHLHGAMPKK